MQGYGLGEHTIFISDSLVAEDGVDYVPEAGRLFIKSGFAHFQVLPDGRLRMSGTGGACYELSGKELHLSLLGELE